MEALSKWNLLTQNWTRLKKPFSFYKQFNFWYDDVTGYSHSETLENDNILKFCVYGASNEQKTFQNKEQW